MFIASRVARNGCTRAARTVKLCNRRNLTLTAPTAEVFEAGDRRQSPSRTAIPKAEPTRTRQLQSAKPTEESQKALELLKKGKVHQVAGLLSDALARDGGDRLAVQLAQGVLLSRKAQERNMGLLFQVFGALPNATQASSSTFKAVLATLRAHDNVRYIKRLGILCASKGYGGFVDSHIAPVLESTCSELDFALWKREATASLNQFQGGIIDVDHVFEDEDNRDYTLAETTSQTSPTPSVMSILESTLPSLLPAPTSNTDFLETEDMSYKVNPAYHAMPVRDQNSGDALCELIRAGQFDAAEEVYADLRQLDTTIPPSVAFVPAAINALHQLHSLQHTHHYHAAKESFLHWIQLVPAQSASHTWSPQLADMMAKLLGHPILDLDFITKSVLVFARKGYGTHISDSSVRVVFLHAPTDVALKFLKDFEEAATAYWEQTHIFRSTHRISLTKRYVRARAIATLARNDRFAAAVSLLPKPDEGWFLPFGTIGVLCRLLHRAKEYTLLEEAKRCLNLVAEYQTQDPIDIRKDAIMPPTLPLDDLPSCLRMLKSQTSKMRAQTPLELEAFIQEYLASGHSRGITLLFNKMIRKNLPLASNLASAEMLFYLQLGYPRLAVETFVDHFYLVGVPLRKTQEVYLESTTSMELGRLHHRGSMKTHNKIAPTPKQSAIIWRALVQLTTSTSELRVLYDKLLQICRHGRDEDHPDFSASTLNREILRNLNGYAFTPFLRRFLVEFGPEAGSQVLNDIVSVGFTPDIVHFTEVAGCYARIGMVEQALPILDSLERAALQNHSKRGLKPDPILYKSIFVGCVGRNDWKIAAEVLRRLRAQERNSLGFREQMEREDPVFTIAHAKFKAFEATASS